MESLQIHWDLFQTEYHLFLSTNLSLECINDELKMFGFHTFNAFLYNMVSILVLHTLEHMSIQLLHYLNLQVNGIEVI